MSFFGKLFHSKKDKETDHLTQPKKSDERYHCVRFMTEKGEQLGMLLTHKEFDTAVHRWVQNVSTMPIDELADKEDEV